MIHDTFTPEVDAYAAELLSAGFTVYLPADSRERELTWFHYSREVDGQTCYGIYYGPSRHNFGEAEHSMPITPSRLNGSSASVGARWGDDDTLGLDDVPVTSVRMAEIVARPENKAPYCTNPATGERGIVMRNAKPYGIGTQYLPAKVA